MLRRLSEIGRRAGPVIAKTMLDTYAKPVIQREFRAVTVTHARYLREKNANCWDMVAPVNREKVRRMAKQYKSVVPHLTADILLAWIKECNPQVHNLFTSTTEWRAWFDAQCQYIRKDVGV